MHTKSTLEPLILLRISTTELISEAQLSTIGPTYNVLMRIHEDVESITPPQSQNFNSMLNPLLIVYARPCRLDGLPGEDISYSIVAPALQSGEVKMCVLEREGARMEVH